MPPVRHRVYPDDDVALFEDVLEAMRGGQTFQIGGGRIFRTYAMREGLPVVIVSDDGITEVQPCDQAELRAAIEELPEGFAAIVRWWRVHGPPTP